MTVEQPSLGTFFILWMEHGCDFNVCDSSSTLVLKVAPHTNSWCGSGIVLV